MKINQLAKAFLCVSMLIAWTGDCLANNGTGQKNWEHLKTERTDTKPVAKDTDIEIRSARRTIVVNTSRQVDIQVFTIIGRLVSADTLQPGIHQLYVPTHGVYIVKAGELTCKVAL